MEKQTELLTLRVSPTLMKRIEEQQKRENVWSRGEMVRQLLRDALEQQRQQAAKRG